MPPAREEPSEVVQSVTTVAEPADVEQARRMKRYLITMGIRTACFIGAFVSHGWLRWALMAGAVVLPYIAVVMVNARSPRVPGRITAPQVPINRHLSS